MACTIIVHHMAKDSGNPSIKVRMTPEMLRALDHVVKVGDYKDRSDVVREMTHILLEAVVMAHEHGKAWKGTWEIFKGIQKLNDRFDKVAKTARESRQTDLFGNQYGQPEYIQEIREAVNS
jgi:Arc/MetJ-type ribon-helix-helix transcriptional regulator